MTQPVLEWSGPHGLSLGGSFKGVNKASLTGFWVHDHIAGRARFKIYKIGVTKSIGSVPTLEKAKSFCEAQIVEGAVAILTAHEGAA